MKPTKMRNKQMYKASHVVKSKQMGSMLSKDLRKRYKKRGVRVVEGDHVSIRRGEFANVDGKVTTVVPGKRYVTIEGIKKEKTKGDKFDYHVHPSNLVITSLNTNDKWRMKALRRGAKSVSDKVVSTSDDDNRTDTDNQAKTDVDESSSVTITDDLPIPTTNADDSVTITDDLPIPTTNADDSVTITDGLPTPSETLEPNLGIADDDDDKTKQPAQTTADVALVKDDGEFVLTATSNNKLSAEADKDNMNDDNVIDDKDNNTIDKDTNEAKEVKE